MPDAVQPGHTEKLLGLRSQLEFACGIRWVKVPEEGWQQPSLTFCLNLPTFQKLWQDPVTSKVWCSRKKSHLIQQIDVDGTS